MGRINGKSMRWRVGAALLSAVLYGGAARAAEQTIGVVQTASARYSTQNRHTVIVQATVGLPNSCWANPRFQTPAAGLKPDADGVVTITVVATSSEGPGVMCAMIFRTGIKVPTLYWRTYETKGLKAIKLVGSTTPVVATVPARP